MYPYVQQLLGWRAQDPAQRIGGLVLEVKGDFCSQVRRILAAANREADYLEVGLNTGVCYNPLHNDLDPYAVAYAIASLLNNLFGKSKEPFWQQAYTDLLKFVISLRRITDGYTTLSEVYRYIIEDGLIDKNIRTLEAQFRDPPTVLVIDAQRLQGEVKQARAAESSATWASALASLLAGDASRPARALGRVWTQAVCTGVARAPVWSADSDRR